MGSILNLSFTNLRTEVAVDESRIDIERWFGQFKLELGPTRQLKDVAELHEAVALAIHYCNTKRIHLALKTTPAAYALIMHKVSTKKGA